MRDPSSTSLGSSAGPDDEIRPSVDGEAPTLDFVVDIGSKRRWAMLLVSTWAQAASSVAVNGPAFLIPALKHERGLSLTAAATLAALSIAGVLVSSIAWGLLVDRIGERRALLLGLTGTALSCATAALVPGTWLLGLCFFLMGVFGASTASASGRVVIGWFPPHRRGSAMGVRQMAQPLGVAVGAFTLASTAHRWGLSTALWIPAVATLTALAAVAAIIIDPPRETPTATASANPYRGDHFLSRIHSASALLVIPQFVVWTFALTWLVEQRHWNIDAAGAMVAVMHVLGAVGRIGVGHLSDVVGSRVRVLSWVALAAAITMALLGIVEASPLAVAVLVVASVITVADNGLSFTSVAERAGSYWAGRALGIHSTSQYAVAAATAPLAGVMITHWGYRATFALVALAPLLALSLVPHRDEHREAAEATHG